MGKNSKGFSVCVWVLVGLPVAFVVAANVLPDRPRMTANGVTEAQADQYHAAVAAAANAKQNRVAGQGELVEIIAPDSAEVRLAEDNAAVDWKELMAAEVDRLLKDKQPGEMVLPEQLADVQPGMSVSAVVERLGKPVVAGETTGFDFFEEGWPGLKFMAYSDDRVAFIVDGDQVEQIVVGIGRAEVVKEALAGEPGSDKRTLYSAYGEPYKAGPTRTFPALDVLHPGQEFAYWERHSILVVFDSEGYLVSSDDTMAKAEFDKAYASGREQAQGRAVNLLGK